MIESAKSLQSGQFGFATYQNGGKIPRIKESGIYPSELFAPKHFLAQLTKQFKWTDARYNRKL
jgi:hypothetical protein